VGKQNRMQLCVFYVKCIGVHCLPGTVSTDGPHARPPYPVTSYVSISPQVHIGFGKFRRLLGTTGPNKIRRSAETAVGMTLSPEGNRVRCAAVEGGVEHGLVEIFPDKIYKYAKHMNVPVACPQQNLSLQDRCLKSRISLTLDHDAFRFEPALGKPTVSVNTCITRLLKNALSLKHCCYYVAELPTVLLRLSATMRERPWTGSTSFMSTSPRIARQRR
jgi:hypothetical protein